MERTRVAFFAEILIEDLHDDFMLLIIGPISKPNNSFSWLNILPSFIKRKVELLLGLPSDEHAIQKLLKDQIGNRVIRLGRAPSADMKVVLGVSDAFIMPNIEVKGDMEGFGLVCIEASMCGANVFASASGGITDAVIHNKNGILLPSGNEDAWIEALNKLINEPQAIDLNPSEIISFTGNHFSWQKMCSEYLKSFSILK